MKTPSASRRAFIKTTAFALPFIAIGCAHLRTGSSRSNEFVRVRNGRFELNGQPHFYAGANMWFCCYLGDATLPGGRRRLVRELDRLQNLGVTNIRLLAGSESSPLVAAISRGITRAPGDYAENLLVGLDFTLAEMAKRNLRGILYLSNYWQWSGGFSQYVSWATGEPIPDPDKPPGDWNALMRMSARLYQTPAANDFYRNYIRKIIARQNTVNGRIYCDDPAIMAWELANEPRAGADYNKIERDLPVFTGWLEATAQLIHELDPNHLVCSGTEGIRGCLDSADAFIASHKTPQLDYVTVHIWAKNWGWLKDPVLGNDFEAAAAKAKDHLEQHTKIATDILKKPLVLEEFGLPRDHEEYSPTSPTIARDEYYRRMFDLVVESCRAGRALQAGNFWAWGGEGRSAAKPGTTANAFVGDPFSEPQGLNCVFDTDTSTQAIIAATNQKLSALMKSSA